MPIEIKELHIRMAVNASPQPAKGDATRIPAGTDGRPANIDWIIAECVEQVLRAVKAGKER